MYILRYFGWWPVFAKQKCDILKRYPKKYRVLTSLVELAIVQLLQPIWLPVMAAKAVAIIVGWYCRSLKLTLLFMVRVMLVTFFSGSDIIKRACLDPAKWTILKAPRNKDCIRIDVLHYTKYVNTKSKMEALILVWNQKKVARLIFSNVLAIRGRCLR